MHFPVEAIFFSGSHALFTGPVSILFNKKNLKLSPMVLFTHFIWCDDQKQRALERGGSRASQKQEKG